MTITIEINKKPYGLTFGMIAVEEMMLRSATRLLNETPTGNAKALTDMFFCANNNYNELNGLPLIKYGTAIELIEELVYSNDIETQMLISETYQNSRATKSLQERLEGEKKKRRK